MEKFLLKAKYVLSGHELLENTTLLVENGYIKELLDSDQLPSGIPLLERPNQLVTPGFVNGHTHMYGVLSHGITVDSIVTEFSSFLDDFWWPYVEDRLDHSLAALTAKWACVEMIRSGVTSFMDILEGPNTLPGVLPKVKDVIQSAGLRGILSFEACERMSKENGQLGLLENKRFIESCSKKDLVQGMMSIHTLFTADYDFVKQAKAMADELGSSLHMHLSESVFEPNYTKEKYGKRPIEIYKDLGVLDQKMFASQLVQLSEKEIEYYQKAGARGVSMPLSNCEVGGGVAPVVALLDRKVPMGLGSDGYINDFFEVMRGAFLIHKAYHQDPTVMSAELVYDMATNLGAKALGVDKVGEIKVGNYADIITIDLNTPTPINKHNVFDQLILFRTNKSVNDVWVNGTQLMNNKELLTISEEDTRLELSAATKEFWESAKR